MESLLLFAFFWLLGFIITMYLIIKEDESWGATLADGRASNEYRRLLIFWPPYLLGYLIDYIEEKWTN